jgi:uncharacterized protein (DUF362 family)
MDSPFLNITYIPELFKTGRNIKDLYATYFNEGLKDRFIELFRSQNFATIIKNKTILVKPNLVLHPRSDDDEKCLTTHPEFILSAVEALLEFKPFQIIIGDSPIQMCQWNSLFKTSFYKKLASFETKFQVKIKLLDFRRMVWSNSGKVTNEIRPLSEYILFDLKENSYLEPITNDSHTFRVTNYNPDRLAVSHKKGRHVYCIAKEIFEADVILQLPKIKTHQKTGITNAIKNLVGINGDKDFLPHHRMGGSESGGDCYPGSNPLRRISEKMLDRANKNIGSLVYFPWHFGSKLIWKLLPRSPYHSLSAGWYGNDTTWRMVADINKIAHFGDKKGELAKQPVRKIFSLCDGIIGGHGNGPLKPIPLPLGVILFTDDSLAADLAAARLMRFDNSKIPLLRELVGNWRVEELSISLNDKIVQFDDLKNLSVNTTPAVGWMGHIEETI